MNNVNVLTLEEEESENSPFHKLNSYRTDVTLITDNNAHILKDGKHKTVHLTKLCRVEPVKNFWYSITFVSQQTLQSQYAL